MTTKMKPMGWHDLPRQSRIAQVMYGVDPEFQAEVNRMAAAEGKQPPKSAPGPTAKPTERAGSRLPPDYSKVPGLRRKWK
jgi:hypothetical protein